MENVKRINIHQTTHQEPTAGPNWEQLNAHPLSILSHEGVYSGVKFFLLAPGLCSGSLATTATVRALVVLDVLGLSRSNLNAFTMEPCLTRITAYPELILSVVLTACTTQCVFMFFLLFLFLTSTIILIFWRWHLGTSWVWFWLAWRLYIHSVAKGKASWSQQIFPGQTVQIKIKGIVTFVPDLLLLLLLFCVFSLVCFLAVPVTTSYMVGRLLIMTKSRFLKKKNHERHQTAANYRKQILLEHRIIEQLNIICFPDIEGNGWVLLR